MRVRRAKHRNHVHANMRRHALSTNICKVLCDVHEPVCMCAGNIIANKYLLPVAGSINIKEKLPKNWKLSLRTVREELLYSCCRFSSVTLKDCIEARYDSS